MSDCYEAEARDVAYQNGCVCLSCVAGIAAALRAAERRGAERMRERAATWADGHANIVIGREIRALPLETGDE
jgi:hypothetical protein